MFQRVCIKLSENENQGSENLKENHDKVLLTVKEVAKHINESPHVIRNWLKELKSYIPTQQGENKYHYFSQEGIDRLLLIQKMSREQGYSIKQIEFYLFTGEDPVKKDFQPEFEDKLLKELQEVKNRLEKQENFNQALIEKLDEQNRYFKESLDKRDENLLETMEQMQQARIEASATKEKKSFWSRFRKNKNN